MAETKRTILLEYDVVTKKLVDENGKAIKSIKQLSEAYKKQAEAAQKMGDVEGENSKIVLGSISHIRNQVSALKQQRDNTAVGSQEFENLNVRLREAEARLKAATTATIQNSNAQEKTKQTTKELAKLQENQARSAGLAGAATFELGRTISDLPFGIVAVTNNISQLGTLFAALVSNAGSVRAALGKIGTQLLGPAGILVAFQVVTAAITYFAQQSNKAKKEVADLNFELEAQALVLEEILRLKKEGAITSEEEEKLLKGYVDINKDIVKLAKEGVISEKEKKALLEESSELFKLRAADEKAQSDRDEQRKTLSEEILELEEERTKEQRKLNREIKIGALGPVEIEARQREINKITEDILLKESQKLDVAMAEANAKADIEVLEENIAKQVQAALDAEKERQSILDKRADALESLVETQTEEEQGLVDQAILDKNFEAFQQHYKELSRLRGQQLFSQQAQELEGVTDQTTINAIEEKYRLLFKALNGEIEEGFRSGLMEIIGETLPATLEGKLSLLDLIDGPEKTEAQQWAEKEVKKFSDAVTEEFQNRVAQTPALNGEGEGAFDFAKAFGMSKERLDATINLAKTALSSIGDILSAEAEREIAIEQNKTNAINDQLRARLSNEQLSADERDKINQQIARNEAKLVAKENEINKKRFEQEKAMNISMAVIDTFSAATGVLADTKGGSFLRIAGMIAVITAGLANIAAISKQKFVGKAMPNPRLTGLGTAGEGVGGPAFNVVGASGQNQLAEAIQGLRNDPLKAYVVSSDVTTAQQLERNIVEGASI